MPGITLYSGNRLELLADRFAGIVSSSPLAVLDKEIIVLQSRGMMKWLTVEMSRRLGVWANFDYIFPNRMTSRILDSFLPGSADSRYFDKEVMTWRCMDLVRERIGEGDFSPLASYVEDDLRGLKLYQLSSKIIDLYDQYMTYRPEMINSWDEGDTDGGWQSVLWRLLTAGMPGSHPPALLDRVYSMARGGAAPDADLLPRRINVFGISYLPMYHLNILSAASNFCDVNLFILNPSSEYWGNILSERERYRIISSAPAIPGDPEDYMHVERGNVLLSSLGRTGRDFLYNIFANDLDTEPCFAGPAGDSLLSMIQGDIFSMTDRGADDPRPLIAEGDRSVTINSCHSVVREVEVLYDYILDLLDGNSRITPGDILVMSPGIEDYSSAIQGVFGRGGGDLPAVPFRIVDRSPRNSSPALDTFFRFLSPDGERFTSAFVAGILECGEIRERFNLSGDDVGRLGHWIRETSIFWGIDSSHREGFGLPGIHQNTWSFGIERMMLGGVMSGVDDLPLGILPYTDIEGSDLDLLGRFVEFFNSICEVYRMLKDDYTLSEWGDLLSKILEMIFITDDVPPSLSGLHEELYRLKGMETGAPFSGRVGVEVISSYLERALSDVASGRDFVSGSLTFCEMLPMRSIPCRVICILGMNDSSFPRKSKSPSFDLMQAAPRRGDRSVRDEDRYLFLETIISARERLYISYTGRSISGNDKLNPSIVVSELIDYIRDNFTVSAPGTSVHDHIFFEQRIQPYNPVYFIKGSGYHTYRGDRAAGARSYALGERGEYRFFDAPLPAVEVNGGRVTLNELISFLVNPSRYLITGRLGVYPELRQDEFIEREEFLPDALSRYNIRKTVLESLLNRMTKSDISARMEASGLLPHGTAGRVVFDEAWFAIDAFLGGFGDLLSGERRSAEIDIAAGGLRVTGRVENIYGGRCVFFRYAKEKGRDLISAWITHLALVSSGHSDVETVLVSKGDIKSWGAVDDAQGILADLVSLYLEGMSVPVPLFPASSYGYADRFFTAGDDEPSVRGMREANSAFTGWNGTGDSSDPYIAKLFGDSYKLSGDFRKFAERVYFPAFQNITGGEGR